MKWLNLALLAALLLTVAAHLAVGTDPALPNTEFLPEMVHSVAYDAYSPNPNFPDGKTLQAPVAGAIPRGFTPLHYGSAPEEAVRAGRELSNPVGPKAAQERGAFLFRTFCLPCHGATGKGDGPVSLRGYPPPPSLLGEKSLNLRDGQIFHILTFGQKNMPSYAAQLSPEDRWRVISFVRSMQQSAQARPTPPPGPPLVALGAAPPAAPVPPEVKP
jgi:mono/diheme cytochrome c family protein